MDNKLPEKIYAWNYCGSFNTGLGLPVVDMGDTPWAIYTRAQPREQVTQLASQSSEGGAREDSLVFDATLKYKRVDLGLKRESIPIDYKDGSHREWEIHNAAFNDGWNEAIDDIKSKYGDLYVEVK